MTTKKNKILMLCDHPLSTSGVGTQARWMIHGLLETGRYSFRVFGGAVRHEDYRTIQVNPDFIIKPTNGFGNREMLRQVLATERPDCLLLFTDPRFFVWVWQMEDEVHQTCPIAYNHLWDNPPPPEYNKVFYESTDLINCINWPTYEMVSKWFPDRTNYIPHAVPENLYRPLSSEERKGIRYRLLGPERFQDFVVLYVGRNARRKMVSDILVSWKMFLEQLESAFGHRSATLLLHTDPHDPEGPNLTSVIDMLGIQNRVVFSRDRVDFGDMNAIYNACDVLVNRSSNEGFGLPVLEAKMAERPVIALKTGGLTRQVEDHQTGVQYGVALEPEIRAIVGNQVTPYIYEDFVSHQTLADAFMKMFEMSPGELTELGRRCRQHALRDYRLEDMVEAWDRTLTDLIDRWRAGQRPARWRHKEL